MHDRVIVDNMYECEQKKVEKAEDFENIKNTEKIGLVVVGWLGRGTTTLHCTHRVLAHRLKVLSLFLLRPWGRNCRDSALRVVRYPDNLLLKLMGSTCPDDGAFLLVLSHVPRRLFLTQWPRQHFRTTSNFFRSYCREATPCACLLMYSDVQKFSGSRRSRNVSYIRFLVL